jgi:cell division protein FtsB
MEMLESRQSELADADIEYLDHEEEEDEEEVVEKRPAVRSTPKKTTKSKKNLLPKIGWSLVGILVLRLIFMDRGVWDYFATESNIREKQEELKDIRTENAQLKTEIARIQKDSNFQRHLAKEHLGVIAADEFLILFAGETAESDEPKPNQI